MAFWKKWKLHFGLTSKDNEQDTIQPGRNRPSTASSSSSRSSNSHLKSSKPTWKDYLLLDTRFRVFYVLVLCVIIGLILPSVISYYLGEYRADLGNCETPTLLKFECLSGSSLTKADCEAAGCCWDSGTGKPQCFHKNPTRYTYEVVELLEDLPHKKVVKLNPERRQTDMFGNSMPAAKVIVRAVNPHHVVVQLLTADQSEDDSFRLISNDEKTPFSQTDFEVSVTTEKRKSFSVVVRRKDTLEVLLDTSYGPLVITDQYVEMSSKVPSEYIYGLGQGEQRSSFKRNFNFGKTALYNRAGSDSFHPFFMAASALTSSFFHGIFWDNNYPLEVQFTPAMAVAFRSMGGSGVLHVFAGPTPVDVSRQWTKDVIGPSSIPPFWALGFHLCRAHDDPQVSRNTTQQMLDHGIPFDSDCIDSRLSGPGAGLADPRALEHRDWLRDIGKKFVLAQPPHVLDPGQLDADRQQWILRNSTSEEYEPGKRWNSPVFYPSYPSSIRFDWDAMLQPEGIHLVDNWPSNEASSQCNDRPRSFVPDILRSSITNGTICLDAFHPTRGLQHLAVHNRYGVDQLEHLTGQSSGYRLLYLNRAAALGNLGRAGYPGDDYTANWSSMKMALVQVLEMGLFGVTLAGSPICGSVNGSNSADLSQVDDEQLCLRWYQLGTLLPLAHSTTKLNHRLRSPVDWSPNSRRILAGYIQQRYRLLPYFYTLFYQASLEGTPVVRPVWYEFPLDNETYPLSEQFMIGKSIMVCPAMIQADSQTSVAVSVHFPPGTWYDYYTGDLLHHSGGGDKGRGVVIMTPIKHVNMFVVNATVFVTQEPGESAEETRKSNYTVTAAFPISSNVSGWLYVDDGVGSDLSAHDLIRFDFTKDTFKMERVNNMFAGSASISTVVNQLRLYGLELNENKRINGDYDYTYSSYTKVLQFNNLNFDWTLNDTYTFKFILDSN